MFYLLFVSLLWAFSFGLIKGNLTGIDPVFVAFARILIALLVFLPFLRVRRVSRQQGLQLLAIGAVQYGLMYMCYNAAFNFLKAYEAALFTIFTPLYITLINDGMTRRFHLFPLGMAALAVVGTGIISYNGGVSTAQWVGFGLMQLSNLCFALGQVAYRRVMTGSTVSDGSIYGLVYLGGALATGLAAALFTPWPDLTLSAKQVGTLIYLGAVASGVGFFLWNIGARRVNVGALAIFNNLKVPLSVLVSLLVFGETVRLPGLILGGLIVLGALGWNEVHQHRAHDASKYI
ncbi:MAG TPA: EamA family transporter [Anaerolineaceae bacterium]|jgi:drug/metabolite transporter (DMT)-like permease|nr:EamA family transporter [Anaerolineaceae bacterium]